MSMSNMEILKDLQRWAAFVQRRKFNQDEIAQAMGYADGQGARNGAITFDRVSQGARALGLSPAEAAARYGFLSVDEIVAFADEVGPDFPEPATGEGVRGKRSTRRPSPIKRPRP